MKKIVGTHTIKSNGDKSGKIVTFTPRFMAKLKTAKHDMVIRVLLDNMLTKLKELTGKPHTINYEQQIELEEFVKSITQMSNNFYLWRIETWMVDGIKNSTIKDCDELFDLLNVIFPALYRLKDELK
ncbi:MAG: hypothetical protein WC358_03375 [Ignavibacteria bacterium]|jgi:hypothetical protein